MTRMMRRVVLLVLDGFGIGAMADVPEVRPQDTGANTMRHLADSNGRLELPVMERLGLGNLLAVPGVAAVGDRAEAAWARAALRHYGADTYAGHQEIAGSAPGKPVAQRMLELADHLEAVLRRAGHRVERTGPHGITLLVDGAIVVADNLEGEAAQNLNVTASLEEIPFERVISVAELVREEVRVGRVIAVMGRGFGGLPAILGALEARGDLVGVNTPLTGIYNEQYQVRHLVLGSRNSGQAPTIVQEAGLPVTLIGKAADVIVCEGARLLPAVDTGLVMDHLYSATQAQTEGLIFANVQETDLAGHEQDARRYADVLALVDRRLPELLSLLTRDDLLLITADHGNDPTKGTKHTREYTPILAWYPGIRPIDLGERATLADLGATVTAALGLGPTEAGSSFYHQLVQG